MSLKIQVGQASQAGVRPDNQDFCGGVTPQGDVLAMKGIMFAIADGVGGHAGGREASEMSVRNVLNDYYATPDTWSITHALEKVISSLNQWVRGFAKQHHHLNGMATTLSLIVLRGQHFSIAHVGDTRIYRLRKHELNCLTTDHVWDRPDMSNVLKRAVGLDEYLQVDYSEGTLETNDIFALMCDGVWATLGDAKIVEILNLYRDHPQSASDELIKTALKMRSQDNVTAIVVRIDQLGQEHLGDVVSYGTQLAIPPRFKVGETIDQFEILESIYESRTSLLYRVQSKTTHQQYVLKTLHPSQKDNLESYKGLLNEEWLGKKIVAHYFPQILAIPSSHKSCLYYVMTYHKGATLEQRLEIGHQFVISEVSSIALRLTRAIATLHRLNILHRDIKPANVHLDDENKLRVIDLGVAYYPNMNQMDLTNPGTPSFMAPELFQGQKASIQTDLYAIGVTLYYILTRQYPYGEIEPFQNPNFGDPILPTRFRPEIPKWFEAIILKAIARDPQHRFETAEELLLALEHGEHRQIDIRYESPLAERNPLFLWRFIALLSIVINLLMMYILVIR